MTKTKLLIQEEIHTNPVGVDASRGLAALTVFISHILLSEAGYVASQVAITAFFILSGSLIWVAAKRSESSSAYWINRVTRILPVYLTNLAACFFIRDALGATTPTVSDLIRHLTFTQEIGPSVSGTFNPVLWTLSYEALFYALVPLLVSLRLPVVIGITVTAVIAGHIFPDFMFAGFFNMTPFFLIGIIMAERRFYPGWIIGFVFLMVGVIVLSVAAAWQIAYACCALGGLSLIMNAKGANQWLAPLGKISYSLYLWHLPVFWCVSSLGITSPTVAVIIAVLSTGFISTLSYFLLEKPFMGPVRRYLVGQISNRKPSAVG